MKLKSKSPNQRSPDPSQSGKDKISSNKNSVLANAVRGQTVKDQQSRWSKDHKTTLAESLKKAKPKRKNLKAAESADE